MTDEVKNDPVTTNDSEESTSNGTGATAPAEEKKAEEAKEEAAPVAAPAVEEKKEEAPVDEGAEVEVPAKFKDIVKAIEEMSVLDLNELVKLFEKKFGVSAAAVAVAGPAAAGGDDAGSSTVTVELTAAGDGKVAVVTRPGGGARNRGAGKTRSKSAKDGRQGSIL